MEINSHGLEKNNIILLYSMISAILSHSWYSLQEVKYAGSFALCKDGSWDTKKRFYVPSRS